MSDKPLSPIVWWSLITVVCGCGGADANVSGSNQASGVWTVEAIATLRDGSAAILARPTLVSVDEDGRFLIEDRSDKNIKVYDSTGQRVTTIGRAGPGPGEFASLQTAQVYRDSIVAYDFVQGRLTFFTPNGQVVRVSNPIPPPWRIQVVDDSLFLFVGHPAQGGKLLRLVRADGSAKTSFFETGTYFDDPGVRQNSVLLADGRDGVVFAGFFGGDSIFAFNYLGRQLAAGPIDPVAPLVSLGRLFRQNGRQLHRADGTWVHDGARALLNLIAIRHSRVALQVATYDARMGTDALAGGTLLIWELEQGKLRMQWRATENAGLIGRDRAGEPLLLKRTAGPFDAFELERLNASSESRKRQ
jgi:hypothetical protein